MFMRNGNGTMKSVVDGMVNGFYLLFFPCITAFGLFTIIASNDIDAMMALCPMSYILPVLCQRNGYPRKSQQEGQTGPISRSQAFRAVHSRDVLKEGT